MARKKGKSPLGNYECLGRDANGDERWRIRLTVNGTDLSEYFTGTEREARLRGAEIYRQQTGVPVLIDDLTLGEYFDKWFIPHLTREKRTNETIYSYSSTFNRWIRPLHGDIQISQITDVMVRQCIRDSGSPRNTKRTYSSILNLAHFEHKVIPKEISLRRMDVACRKRREEPIWSIGEVLEAIKALEGEEIVWPYLMLGLCGMRPEEALGWTPSDLKVISMGQKTEYALGVEWTYTDKNGWQRRTKTADDRLTVLSVLLQSQFLSYLDEVKPKRLPLPNGSSYTQRLIGWGRSQRARYSSKLLDGSREEIEPQIRALERPYGKRKIRPRIEEVGDSLWSVTYFDGVESLPKRLYERTMLDPGREDESLRSETRVWAASRLIPATYGQLNNAWKNALARHGLRYVPPSTLRKASESIMTLANVPETVIQKLHGHKTFKMDYEHYIKIGAQGALLANEALSRSLDEGNLATNELKVRDFPWAMD